MPPYGWLGLDPTLGTRCTGRHVKVAVGRDYADVPPLRGTYRGGGEALMDVAVRGEMLEEAQGVSLARTPSDEWGRGRLIQYQTLGASAQMQRLGAMKQSLGGMTQTLTSTAIGEVAGMRHQQTEAEVPRQQPQQQQQG